MSGERFFVPSTAWLAQRATRAAPSFFPGQISPAWLAGAAEVREVLLLCEPVTTLLYLAGYDVPTVMIGRGDGADDWVAFDCGDLRIRLGTASWSSVVGAPHPGPVRVAAIHASPMPHFQRGDDPVEEGIAQPIPLDLNIGGVGLDASTDSWIQLDLSPATAGTSVNAVRDQLLDPVTMALTTFQSARTVARPPGLAGIYDPTNWVAVGPSPRAASPAADLLEGVRRLTLRLTGGSWSNDDDPGTAPVVDVTPIRDLLEVDLPQHASMLSELDRPPDWEVRETLGWVSLDRQVGALQVGIFDVDDIFRELAAVAGGGVDAEVLGLTTTILDIHDRERVDVIGGFAAATTSTADPCANAAALAADLDTPLSAEGVAVMCDCLIAEPATVGDIVMQRLQDDLAKDYAALFTDAESRASIRDILIDACLTANSTNPVLNAGGVGAPLDSSCAEWFAKLLAAVLTSEPRPDSAGYDVTRYLNPLVEVGDVWDRWKPLLDGRAESAKLVALTCDVFADTGHAHVALQAADAVIAHYRPRLQNLANELGQHWTHPMFGDEFRGSGSTRPGVEGWCEDRLVSLLRMLGNTHDGGELVNPPGVAFDVDVLFELVGGDPLLRYNIELFEGAYADLLATSPNPLVAEHTLLLSLLSAYSSSTTEAEAARYNVPPLELRFGDLVQNAPLAAEIEAAREEAFLSIDNEWLSLEDLQLEIESFVTSPSHEALLLCLDEERRQAHQDAVADRVRRVCPAANEVVMGVFVGVSFVIDSAALIEEIDEAELASMLDDVAAVHDYQLDAIGQKVGKVCKEGPAGIAKAIYAKRLSKVSVEDVDLSSAAWPVVALRRRELWGARIPDASNPRPTDLAIDTYIRRSDALGTLIKSMDDAALASDVAAGTGHMFTVLVGGLVLWQLNTEGEPTAPDKILGASRDLGTAAASMVQLGALAVKWFAEDRWNFAWVIEPVEAFGRFASKLSTFISLLANGLATVRYIAQGDWVGATLMFLATGASVVAFAATAGVVSAPIGAVAATVAAIFAVIDVVRLAVFPPAEQVRWEQIVGARQLLFARRVAIGAPCEGDLVVTQPLPRNQLVDAIELGTIEVPVGGADNSNAEHAFIDVAVGDGITAVYAIADAERTPVTVTCPIPAVTSRTLLTDDRERFVNVGDTLLSVLPRFESWLLALDTVFDAVFVVVGQHVDDGEVVATLDGDQVRAPRAGTVLAFETLPDSERIRIRADTASVVVEG